MLNPFAYHRPDGEQIPRIEAIREAFWWLLLQVTDNTKPGSISGRYVALAKTALEEAAMWSTKAIVFEADNTPDSKPADR